MSRLVKCHIAVFLHRLECATSEEYCTCEWSDSTNVGDTMLLLRQLDIPEMASKLMVAVVPKFGLMTFFMHPKQEKDFYEDV